ncbi:MAG: hypothetical protein HY872_04145 [Chloroflexi bacterium]|nr:hypothetical protein [Chloroflexota bacterium]
MNNYSSTQLILEGLVAIGTIAVAILAIWGDWFRDKFAAPKLVLQLRDTKGNLTSQQDGQGVIYYHLIVQNKRSWAVARGVQVMLEGVWRRAADGSFKADTLAAELPLTWAFPQFSPLNPSVSDRKICDFGCLAEKDRLFKPSLYFYPNNFTGFVGANQAVRYSIRVVAENFNSGKAIVVEVSWDGLWSSDMAEMERHLVVKVMDEKLVGRQA